jgi:hypothetical protein
MKFLRLQEVDDWLTKSLALVFPAHWRMNTESEKNRGRWLMICQINKIRTSPAISFPVYDLGHRRYFGNLTIATARTGCSNVNLPRFFSLSMRRLRRR